jgi:DNA-directed RNA polymerase subunit RPC12/RpoP
MVEKAKALYICCPICGKAIGKSKRIDGLEMQCPKCGSSLKITVDNNAKVSVELIGDKN